MNEDFAFADGCDVPTRIALVGIVVDDLTSAENVNRILHDFAPYIVGRMGIPYRQKGVSIISVILDAPQTEISSLAGKLGLLSGVNVKTICSKIK